MVTGRIVSVNVGFPRDAVWNGRNVSTAIFKDPVGGRVRVRTLGLEGDKQADLTVHGGPQKALYAYPSEHYEFWATELNLAPMAWGMFGENLTTQGLLESEVLAALIHCLNDQPVFDIFQFTLDSRDHVLTTASYAEA